MLLSDGLKAKRTRKGLLLPIFFEKILIVFLVTGVIFWMLYSSINTEEISVTLQQERNEVELWHQVLRSDIFRAESSTSASSERRDMQIYFDKDKIDDAYDDTSGSGGVGDISCSSGNALDACINFYPNMYMLKIESGDDTWYFSNDGSLSTSDFSASYDFAEIVGVKHDDPNPSIGNIYFKVDMYE